MCFFPLKMSCSLCSDQACTSDTLEITIFCDLVVWRKRARFQSNNKRCLIFCLFKIKSHHHTCRKLTSSALTLCFAPSMTLDLYLYSLLRLFCGSAAQLDSRKLVRTRSRSHGEVLPFSNVSCTLITVADVSSPSTVDQFDIAHR